MNLDVVVPPTVLERPESVTYPTARTARFHCEVLGVPAPNITWYKNGNRVEFNGEIVFMSKVYFSL